MRIEDMRTGHWLVVAVVVGAGMAFTQTNSGVGSATQDLQPAELEALVWRAPVKDPEGAEYPWVKDITIRPATQTGVAIPTRSGLIKPFISMVTCSVLTPVPNAGGWTYKDRTTYVLEPYEARRRVPEPGTNFAGYLAQVQVNAPALKFTYAWWRLPQWAYGLWIGGMVLVVGVIWPIILRQLVGAGLGKVTDPNEKKQSLRERLFGKSSKTKARASGTSGPSRRVVGVDHTLSGDEMERLSQMEDGLKDFLRSSTAPPPASAAPAAPAVQLMEAGPLEALPEQEPEKPKDYAGDFYPTVAHAPRRPEMTRETPENAAAADAGSDEAGMDLDEAATDPDGRPIFSDDSAELSPYVGDEQTDEVLSPYMGDEGDPPVDDTKLP